LIVCFASIALGDDFKTINGKEYKNATVNRVELDGGGGCGGCRKPKADSSRTAGKDRNPGQ
jgi:hypothetical protein